MQAPISLGEQPLALRGGGAARIPEHAVRAHRPYAIASQVIHESAHRPGVAGFGLVVLHRGRIEVQQQGGLGAAGVGITARGRHVKRCTAAALGTQARERRVDGIPVATVRVDQQHRLPVARCVSAEFEQQLGQRGRADRQRASEVGVFSARAEGDRRRHRDILAPRGRPARDRERDARVGVQRQVRTVLLE